jgi:TRAP-type C4-dicarboxylate transport system permease small subunit
VADGRPRDLVARISVGLALGGGCLVLVLALLVTDSVLRRWLTADSVPGDFELVQNGLAIAVFAFLPICQLHGANITVDTFTRAGPAWVQAGLDGVWALAYGAVAGLIAWQTAVGARETLASGTTTMVLGLPIGWAMALSAVFAAWLVVVAIVTATRAWRGSAA